jgi:hypothetical protein
MAVNKSFVIKNGLEVNTQLILADANTNKVGIGSTAPRFELDVAGGIGATDSYVSGISTVFSEFNVGTDGSVLTVLGVGGSVGVGTAIPEYLLDVRSPVSTGQTALYVQGDVKVTGDLFVDDITFDQADINNLNVTGIATISQLGVTNSTSTTNLTVTGISTFDDYIDINDNADISGTLNVGGATTLTGYVDINNSLDVSVDVNVGGLTTLGGYVDINDNVDISADLNVVGIATIATVDINAGDINVSNIESTNLNVTGIATIATVDINAGDIEVTNVDTANLNVTGIATIATISVVGAELTNLNVTGVTTLGTVQVSSGIVTATSGIVTYYGDGSQLLGVIGGIGDGTVTPVKLSTGGPFWNSSGDVLVSGIATISNASGTVTIGIGTTALLVEGNARVTGILSVGQGTVTINGNTNQIVVGTGVTIYGNTGIISATTINATNFVGNGSGLTGAGSTVADDTTTNSTFYPLFTSTTSGTVTASKVSTTKLSFNPSTGTLNATNFVGNGSGLTGAGSTVADDTTTNSTFYPLFTSTTSGTVTASKVSTTKLSFNPSTGTLSATAFNGPLGGNSTTATALQTARSINGVSFNGSADITVNPTSGAFSNGQGAKTIQSGGSASGGSSGDIYYIY